jgi:hypothetical protein
MTKVEKHIVESYASLFDQLSPKSKLALLEKLTLSIRKSTKTSKNDLLKSFGAFGSDQDAAEIVDDLKKSRNFRNKDLNI